MIPCLIRKTSVNATPEERVRQGLIEYMIQQLGYPASLLAIEKDLSVLPHLALSSSRLPLRRADLLCFAKEIHPEYALYPLLLVECKSVPLTQRVLSQVTGYNHFVGAYFICVANANEIKTGSIDPTTGNYQFVPFLPSYKDLLQQIRSI